MLKKWYLISYDVRDPKRLRRVAKRLAGYGTRVQYSVFRCCLRSQELERLLWDLTQLLLPEDDLLIIGLCGECASRIRCRSQKQDWVVEELTYEVV